MKDYPFVCPVQVRWRDLDAFVHVNNATFASYCEIARTEVWQRRLGGRDALSVPFFVKRLEIEYLRPISLYDEVQVWLRVGELSGASFTFEYLIEANGVSAAEALTEMVHVDNKVGKPLRLPPDLSAKLESLQVE